MVAVALFVGFVVGALVVIGVEVVGVLFLIRKLGKKLVKEEDVKSASEQLQFSSPNKQGWVWVLDKEKIPKSSQSTEKNLRQEKRKIEIIEVTPVRKHASIKDKSLTITDSDETPIKIDLSGCIVEAVSATNLPSRKWAKKYPIKVENKSSVIYHGSKLFYMYFETSSEKESWCKALRLASCDDKEKLVWFNESRSQFHSYLQSLNVEYPSFLKPSIGFNPEIGDRSIRLDVDGSSSSSAKVRQFLKKLAKKTSKTGREDRKFSENSVGGSSKPFQPEKKSTNGGAEEKNIKTITPGLVPSGSRNSDAHSNDKVSDEGTLCCNLLISRLFFDAKSNVDLRNSIQARIQRTLSAIRTPSYIGEIICTGVDPGNIPPYIHGMRVLPSDLKEVVAMEIDVEYNGGAVLDIETRIEVQELENQDLNSGYDVTTDLLEGLEYNGEQLNHSEQTNQDMDQKAADEIRKLEDTKSSKSNEQASSTLRRWKSVLNSVAKQVSQVPLSLAIRVTSLRGTLRVHIKPPPSDQIWFGFTSMPDIDFSLESAVGDHKITSGHIALFIIGKFKMAIRETMVLPNSESVTIPFMLAEKNDWLPQKVAPFIWTNPELTTEPAAVIHEEVHRPQPCHDETHPQEDVHKSSKNSTETTHDKTTLNQSDDDDDDEKSGGSDEKAPLLLLENEEQPSPLAVEEENKVATFQNTPRSPPTTEESDAAEGDDAKFRRLGTKAKMLGLRKKMGEKLEEKRRNIEEKGRHIVEKMRGPGATGV